MYKKLLPFVFLATFSVGHAQVSITQDDLPVASIFYSVESDEDAAFPLPALGANKNWSYTNFTPVNTLSVQFKAASSSPYASQFPQATLVVEETGDYPVNAFYGIGKNGLYLLGGFDLSSGDKYEYNPARLLAVAPISYGQTIKDSSRTTYTTNGGTKIKFFRQIAEAVGWGSITTPAGTFANTLLVRETYFQYDITNGPASQANLEDTGVEYSWLQKDNKLPYVFSLSLTESGSAVGGSYFTKQEPLAVQGPRNPNFSLHYPVPADQQLTIEFKKPLQGTLRLLSIEGTEKQRLSLANASSASVDVSELPAGMYLYEITLADGSLLQNKVVVVH